MMNHFQLLRPAVTRRYQNFQRQPFVMFRLKGDALLVGQGGLSRRVSGFNFRVGQYVELAIAAKNHRHRLRRIFITQFHVRLDQRMQHVPQVQLRTQHQHARFVRPLVEKLLMFRAQCCEVVVPPSDPDAEAALQTELSRASITCFHAAQIAQHIDRLLITDRLRRAARQFDGVIHRPGTRCSLQHDLPIIRCYACRQNFPVHCGDCAFFDN